MKTDSTQESLLRTTLIAHAPQSVDIEQGWQAVSQRIPALTLNQQVPSKASARIIPLNGYWQTQRRYTWPVLALVATLVIALLSTGSSLNWFAGNTSSAGKSNTAYAFSDVTSPTQTMNGITVSVLKAYADPQHLYIEYKVHLSDKLAQIYNFGFPIGKIQNPYAKGPGGDESVCSLTPAILLKKANNDTICVTVISRNNKFSLQPPKDATIVNIGWNISKIRLIQLRRTPKAPLIFDLVSGHWNFQFTIPFHQQTHTPVFPFSSKTLQQMSNIQNP